MRCSEIVHKHFLLKKLSRREVKFNSKPWITRALRKSISYKNIQLNLLLVTTNIKSIETNLLRLSKKLYYRNYFLANQSNVKNVWKGIRQLVTLKPKESFKPSRIVIDNQEITDPKTIANEFNNYFATIGSRLAAQIPICGSRTHKFYLDTPSSSSFFLLPVSNTEIIEIKNHLNLNKSTGVLVFQ